MSIKLITITLNDNQIKEINLKDFEKLKFLGLNGNPLKEITLENLPQLDFLNLRDLKLEKVQISKVENMRKLILRNNQLQECTFLSELSQLIHLDLQENPISDISPVKKLENLFAFACDFKNLPYPSICFAYLKEKGGKLGDYLHLSELPQVEKIWELLRTKNEKNIELARQLAKGLSWEAKDFAMYVKLVYS